MFNHIVRAYELLLEPQVGPFGKRPRTQSEVYHREQEVALAAAVHRGIVTLGNATQKATDRQPSPHVLVTAEAVAKA